MFTSVTEAQKRKTLRAGVVYVCTAAFCMFFAAIYTLNGFGRSSVYMSLCFVPCAVSSALFFVLGASGGWKAATTLARYLWHFGTSILTVAMALTGIFNIAGVTVNRFMPVYWLLGALLPAASVVSAIVSAAQKRSE